MEGSFKNKIRQFVSQVLSFTSQYSETSWRAQNLVGPPAVLNVYGDSTAAWCPANNNEDQIIELLFETSIFIHQVRIFENFNGGGIGKIEAYNQDHYEVLWSTESTDNVIQTYNIFSPEFVKPKFQSNRLRITVRQSGRSSFSELDAVELVGLLVDIEVPKKSLAQDIKSILNNPDLCDLEINCEGDKFPANKCILAIRVNEFYEFLKIQNFKIDILNKLELKLVLEYIYTDDLNEELLNEIIAEAKRNQVTDEGVQSVVITDDEDIENKTFDYKSDKSVFIVNNLIRFSIRFKMDRLEKLLLNYLMYKYLNLDNCLNIFMDTIDNEIKLKNVEEVCLSYVKVNIKNVIKLDKFKLLPKKALIKIVVRI